MIHSLTATYWLQSYPHGFKQIIVANKPGLDLVTARQQYANEQSLTLLSGGPDGRVTLYWDKHKRLVRLAIEWLTENSMILNFSDHV